MTAQDKKATQVKPSEAKPKAKVKKTPTPKKKSVVTAKEKKKIKKPVKSTTTKKINVKPKPKPKKAPVKRKTKCTPKASEKLGLTMGRPLEFKSPEELFEKACEYFLWAEENPLLEQKLFSFQGKVITGTINKMRAYTMQGLCVFMNITTESYRNYKKREDFFGVTTRIDEIIYNQKFTGAAADMLNPNIIARDLGLADKKEVREITDDMETLAQLTELLAEYGIDANDIKRS